MNVKRLLLTLAIGLIGLLSRPANAGASASLDAQQLAIAVAEATAGDTLHVHGGLFEGQLVIDKPLTLIGIDWPTIDGGGSGTVVQIDAPDVTLRGFVVRNSGDSLDLENAGIAVEGSNANVSGNRLEETLFGIYLREAHGSTIRANEIGGKDLALQRRGDPIRVWYSNDVVIEENSVVRGRDVVLWYSERLVVRGNEVSDGRYGLHFMYCDDALIESNRLTDNSVGAFLMYSRRLTMRHNAVAGNRGPSGYGIGLKDMDDAVVHDNLFIDNRVGAYVDGSPREVDSIGRIENNLFGYNDIGILLLPAVRNNEISGNSFVENEEQVNIGGGGRAADNLWTVDGRGNYWSDYAGYDVDEDDRGDLPYAADRFFESIMARRPALRLFVYSPATNALDIAARAFPIVQPQPKLVDTQPLLTAHVPDAPLLPRGSGAGWQAAGAGLLLIALALITLSYRAPRQRHGNRPIERRQEAMITISHLTKRFGKLVAVDDVSSTIAAGEAVAFWGANGAGKTTLLHCLLGLTAFEGSISFGGIDVAAYGKQVRRQIGFVPQQLSFHDDLTVAETLNFYAGLKKVAVDETCERLLARLELTVHRGKRVGDLSGGLKQRLALALALLADPPVLLLDEPTANLDISARDDFMALLLQLKHDGKTLLFSSHRFEEVTALADRVLLLEAGKLVIAAPPLDVARYSGRQTTLHLLLPSATIAPATELLRRHGLIVNPNGQGVRVQVAERQKGEALRILHQAGVVIDDFVIE